MAGGGLCRGRGRRLEQYWIPLTARVNFAAYAPPDLVAAPPLSHSLIALCVCVCFLACNLRPPQGVGGQRPLHRRARCVGLLVDTLSAVLTSDCVHRSGTIAPMGGPVVARPSNCELRALEQTISNCAAATVVCD